MLETIQKIITSQHPWSGVSYLALGTLLGALLGNRFTIAANRPRLTAAISGGGGDANESHCTLAISNTPSFIGIPLDGESAKDVHVYIQPRVKGASPSLLYWDDPAGGQLRNEAPLIEPYQSRPLELFRWKKGVKGYTIRNWDLTPARRFDKDELVFDMWTIDRLQRKTVFSFTAHYDDSLVSEMPRVTVLFPTPLSNRWARIKGGAKIFVSAFTAK